MTYNEFIQNILDTRGRFNCGDEYCERHHVIPKCMGGTNDEENLIDLFAREHFEAHRLLALENPNNEKLVYAWWCMCSLPGSSKKREDVVPEEYEEARIHFAEVMSERMKGKNSPLYGVSHCGEHNPMYGKNHTEETKNKMRASHKGLQVGENHPMYGKHHSEEAKKKISEAFKGENNPNYGKHFSTETCQKLSESHKGENHPMHGKHHSEGTKRKMSENSGKVVAIYCPQLDEEFMSIVQASIKYRISRSSISLCINGKRKYAGKHPVTGEHLIWVKLEK